VLISDRDVRFTSLFWTALMKRLGVKLNLSTAYHLSRATRSELRLFELTKNLVYYHTSAPAVFGALQIFEAVSTCQVFFVNGSGALPEWILVQISIAQWWRISVDLSLVSPGNLIGSFRWLASDLVDNIFACICVPACLHKRERTCLP
jgi:hypothetical protein